MAQYWLQIPVENAKEVVQRKIDELVASATLPDLAGYTVSYDADCEVVLDGNDLINNQGLQPNNIYFGTLVANFDGYFGAVIKIEDYLNNYINIFDWVNNQCNSGHYPYIIWNSFFIDGFQPQNGYFFGYKFNLNPPA